MKVKARNEEQYHNNIITKNINSLMLLFQQLFYAYNIWEINYYASLELLNNNKLFI